jgi:hypothetical protein
MQPYNIKTTKKDLIERNSKIRIIDPELRKMHEIFGDQNADCGMAAKYEDGTCSKIVYDPAKRSFRKRTGLDFSSTEPVKDYPIQPPTEAETHAKRLYDFITFTRPRETRFKT